MKYPKFLNENDTIMIVAPSAGADSMQRKNKFNNAIKYFENRNYKVLKSKNLFKNEKGRSASAKERAEEINDAFKSNKDFVLCATGGDFLIEILPFINFELIKNKPKFIAGFSDPTGLLYPITTKYDIATIYGQNLSSFGSDILYKCHEDFVEIIKGNLIELNNYDLYEEEALERVTGLEGYNLTEKVEWKNLENKNVNVTGRIIGGCMDIIAELSGTKYDGINEFNERYKDDGIIWYFDNCEFSMEETIRTLWRFNELGYFKYAKCIIFGRFGRDVTYYDYDIKSCLLDSVLGGLNIPIIYDADFSHKSPCLPVINGAVANFVYNDGNVKISYELK